MSNKKSISDIKREIVILSGRLEANKPKVDRAYDRLEKAERYWDKIAIPHYDTVDYLVSLKKKLSRLQSKK